MAKGQSNQGVMQRKGIGQGGQPKAVVTRMTAGETLTPKMRGFAQDVAKGLNLSDAYRNNYDCSNMQNNTINANASALMRDSRVMAMVDELVREVERAMVKDAVAIRKHVFDGLMRESKDFDEGSSMSRIKALELLGKIDIVSMFKDRVEKSEERSADTIRAELERRLGAYIRHNNAT